jgi:hypothetical protein
LVFVVRNQWKNFIQHEEIGAVQRGRKRAPGITLRRLNHPRINLGDFGIDQPPDRLAGRCCRPSQPQRLDAGVGQCGVAQVVVARRE